MENVADMNPCFTVTTGKLRIGKLFEPCTDGGMQPLGVLLFVADHACLLNVTAYLSLSDLERLGLRFAILFPSMHAPRLRALAAALHTNWHI